MCFPKTLASTCAALGVFLSLAGPLSGEEGGAGDYIPGLYASLINITPNQPGFALGSGYLFYTGSVGTSATLPFGGILASKISADVSLADLSLTYTFRPTILGAHYTVSVSIPYVWWMLKQRYRSIPACSHPSRRRSGTIYQSPDIRGCST
jgi:hypothetical protein